MKACLYLRVSGDSQEEGTSLDSQYTACLQKAHERGYVVPEDLVFREVKSGLSLDRPLLTTLRQKAKAGELDAVIAYVPDRLARVGEDILLLLKEFRGMGVKLIFVKAEFEDSLQGKVLAFMFVWASELEASNIKERTRRGKRTLVERGVLPQGTGIGIYGYRWDKAAKKRVPVDFEVRVVDRIFSDIAEGRTRFEVARDLNSKGIPTKSGSKWHPLTVNRIVTNPSYIGTTYFYRTVREGKQVKLNDPAKWVKLPDVTPAIISQELFDRAQRVLDESKRIHRGRPEHDYLLTGHVSCGLCGAHMVGSYVNHAYRYYTCSQTRPTSSQAATCRAAYVNAATVEAAVWKQVVKVLEHPDVLLFSFKRKAGVQGTPDTSKIEREIAQARRTVERCQERQERLLTLFEHGNISEADLEGRLDKIRAEHEQAEASVAQLTASIPAKVNLASAEAQLKTFCRKVSKSLKHCSFANKRLALDALRVQVVAAQDRVSVKMAVPLEFTAVEQKREFVLPKTKRVRRKVAVSV